MKSIDEILDEKDAKAKASPRISKEESRKLAAKYKNIYGI